MALILDLETIAIPDAASLVEPVEAAKNLKDPEKIAADIAKKTADQIDKAALYPWTARIIAAGWCETPGDAVEVRTVNADALEATLLRELAERIIDQGYVVPIVTFNGLGFDLPVLMARARLLGVSFPALDVSRFKSPHPDLLKILTFDGAIPPRSLKWFAKRFGLNTDDAFSGREIAQLYEDGNWDAIRAHVTSDVTLTRQLAERVGVVKTRQGER
jgi:predicted PolB exonuclease-like 3'-5' exonuclease